jgi:hypothetical protein
MPLQDTIANLEAAGLDNPSIGGIYKVMAEAIQIPVDTISQELSNASQGLVDLFLAQNYGKSGYYITVAKAFQYGDSLSIDSNGNFYYPVIDTTKQIIKQAAMQWDRTTNFLSLKVATKDPTGAVIALSSAQLAAFVSYMQNFLIEGIPVNIVSLSPNVITFNASLTYYSTYDLPTLKAAYSAALLNFQNNFTYNGTFYQNDFSDYIKANVAGVRDFFLNSLQMDGAAFSGSINLPSGTFTLNIGSVTNYQSV